MTPHHRHSEVGAFVHARATRLQEQRDHSAGVAALARLRANIGKEPGVDSTIWAWTVEGLPGTANSDAPTASEWAVHTALTLFALHQQSRSRGIYVQGETFGRAIARLDRTQGGHDEGTSPVRRRLNAVVTSTSYTELTYHLRGLVSQLRAHDIPLDYAALADDLFQFQLPGQADAVRRRWARQFHHVPAADALDTSDTPVDEHSPTKEAL